MKNKLYIGIVSILTFSVSCIAMQWTERVSGPVTLTFNAGTRGSVEIKASEDMKDTAHKFFASGNRGCIELPRGIFILSVIAHNCDKKNGDVISIELPVESSSQSDQESGSSDIDLDELTSSVEKF